MASGKLIGSFALTEPEAGSDAGSVRTTARRDGETYVLNGTKRYITNAPQAGLFTVFARTDPETKGGRGVSAFLVEAGTPGISLGPKDRKMGHSGAHSCDVIFEDCRVPATSLLGREGEGQDGNAGPGPGPHPDRLGLLRGRRTADPRKRRLCRRTPPVRQTDRGVPAGPGDAGRQPGRGVRRPLDGGSDRPAQGCGRGRRRGGLPAARCSHQEMVGRVADRAVQVHGGAGYIADYDVERIYRDVRLFRIYEGTTQIQQLVIAKRMLAKHRG